MIIPLLGRDLLIRADQSFLLCGLAGDAFTLFIETSSDEICQFLQSGDIIAVSAPEGGDLRQAQILLELVRTWHAPLVVLPPGHPGSGRLKMVVSAGDIISLHCSIQRGTHPEQTVICSSEELAGTCLYAVPGGIEVKNLPDCTELLYVSPEGLVSGIE
jgi:hypothetical protein